MQAFKTLLIVAVLSAVAYGVYVALTGARDTEPPPGVVADHWDGAPDVELPNFDAPGGAPPNLGPPAVVDAAPAGPQVVQPQPSAVPEAPPFDAPAVAVPEAGAAPPFAPPGVGPGDPAAIPSAAAPAAPLDGSALPAVSGIDPAGAVPAGAGLPPADAAMTAPLDGGVPPPASGIPESNFATDYAAAQALLLENRLDPALLLLSRWYDDPRLTPQEQEALMPLLNQLAGTVIYSREHLLLPAYEVQPGDTLDRVAQHYQVPWQVLAKINGVADPNQLRPGEQLKMIQGPFHAVVNLRTQQLTLMVGGRFAGRFPFVAGSDRPLPDGEFPVKAKSLNAPYYGTDRVIDAGDPANPLGKYWIGLDEQLGIHGTNDQVPPGQADTRGSIRMNTADVEHVYDMLSAESRVRIVR